ncbi:MAG: helix-turn-helix domain-containing protein [Nitrospinae bacterium]|nr:helix-turn-helix domain-containing protein [Nitrospinota bacterium]
MAGRRNRGGLFASGSPASGAAQYLRRKFFTTTQLASRWKVSSVTVIRLIEEGQLKGLKIRRMYRVSVESVESYERKVSF